ncbi:MAG: ABC transporter substrate-binding protein [Brachymonas sp.]|nr:ABC transporter substrate-binding protein [Brachymonas sp.]
MKKNAFALAAKCLGGVLLACCALAGQAQAADLAPDAMVQKVAGETLAQIKADALLQTGDVSHIITLVDRNVMPHVNFTRLTGTAVGPAWRTATPEQKKRLEKEFKTLLARTYAGAFKLANDKELKVLPMRGAADGNDVLVQTQLVGGGEPVPMDYRLEKTPGQGLGWKAYNLSVSNVWMIQSYRQQFAQVINSSGIDGLISRLEAQNKSNAGK